MQPKLKTLAAVTIASTSAAARLSATSLQASSVVVTADSLNTGAVYVGDSTVTASNGQPLTAGQSIVIEADNLRGSTLVLDMSDIYVATATNGNVVRVAYLARR